YRRGAGSARRGRWWRDSGRRARPRTEVGDFDVNGVGWGILLVLAVILIGGFFAGAEMALVSLREGQVRALAKRGRRGQRPTRCWTGSPCWPRRSSGCCPSARTWSCSCSAATPPPDAA